jgi:hypothetical protein
MARYVMVLRVQHHYKGHWKGWALKTETFLGPEMTREKRVLFGPKKVEPSKPLSISAIKTTGTLVVLCTRVLLCGVVVCKRGGEVFLQLYCVSCEEVLRGWGVVGRPPPPPPTIL